LDGQILGRDFRNDGANLGRQRILIAGRTLATSFGSGKMRGGSALLTDGSDT
jgi:hypothetical protein